MACETRGTNVAECFPIFYSQIPLMKVADSSQLAHNCIENRVIFDYHIQINAWFGGQTFHRGTAHMLDAGDQITEGKVNFLLNLLKS